MVIEDVDVQVVRKKIKNLHLKVCPPDGQVKLSIPHCVSNEEVRIIIGERLPWIRKHQARFRAYIPPQKRQIVSGETHYYFGQPLTLQVIEAEGRPSLSRALGELKMHIKPGATLEQRERLLNDWYRRELKAKIPSLLEKWQKLTGCDVAEWNVKRMKTRWGSCNIKKRRIWLSLSLAQKPLECLEYILVHEIVHLLERKHNAIFKSHMDAFMPDWREHDKLLNQ